MAEFTHIPAPVRRGTLFLGITWNFNSADSKKEPPTAEQVEEAILEKHETIIMAGHVLKKGKADLQEGRVLVSDALK